MEQIILGIAIGFVIGFLIHKYIFSRKDEQSILFLNNLNS